MGMMNRKALAALKPGQRVKPRLDTGPGLTKQEFAKDADINVLMKRFGVTGVPVDMGAGQAVFADVSGIGSYADVVRRVAAAEEAFMALPPEVRTVFGNDAVRLVEFLQDDRNYDEAVKLGLVQARSAPVAPTAPVEPAKPA